MCSAIPIALLCMVVNQNERKQESGTDRDEVHRGTFVCLLFVCPSISPPQALSGLKSALSGLESAISGLKFTLSGLKPVLPGLESPSQIQGLRGQISSVRGQISSLRGQISGLRGPGGD